MNKPIICLAMTLLLTAGSRQLQAQDKTAGNYVVFNPGDTEADKIRKAAHVHPSERQLNWQEKELTAFFHFGVNTFSNREWGDGRGDPAIFNPTNLDADQWVRTCKDAGIRQVILTAKHHDGFCLWPSKYTAHSVKNSPWKNGKGDVVKEVAQACRKYNIGFGVYLSPWDRNAAFYGDSAKYNTYFINQLTELLTQYGKVDEVWFDGANGEGPNGKKQVYDFENWYKLIRKLQPQAVIAIMGPDVRWVGTESGYGRTTEWSVLPVNARLQQSIAANSQKDINFVPKGDMTGDDLGARSKIVHAQGLIWYPAETDVSIRPGWFYHAAEDDKVKSPEKLLDIYYSSVGRNGVLLLNIPPGKDGKIQPPDVQHLQEWKRLRDETFRRNLLKDAAVQCDNGLRNEALTDNNNNTWWTTKGNDTSTVINFTLPTAVNVDVLLLQENIREGQRIEQFTLEYQDGSSWKTIAEGTTVGYKRLLRFAPVTVRNLRLRISSSRMNPTLASVGLYKQAQ